jgi:hypothetical protein
VAIALSGESFFKSGAAGNAGSRCLDSAALCRRLPHSQQDELPRRIVHDDVEILDSGISLMIRLAELVGLNQDAFPCLTGTVDQDAERIGERIPERSGEVTAEHARIINQMVDDNQPSSG